MPREVSSSNSTETCARLNLARESVENPISAPTALLAPPGRCVIAHKPLRTDGGFSYEFTSDSTLGRNAPSKQKTGPGRVKVPEALTFKVGSCCAALLQHECGKILKKLTSVG